MNAALATIANLGAEESAQDARGVRDGARAAARHEAVRTAARLWRLALACETPFSPAPSAVGPRGLGGSAAEAIAWLNTERADDEARSAGLALRGPAPAVVRRVHDKAFAIHAAGRLGLEPAPLTGAFTVLEPAELEAPDALAQIAARTAAWPAWARVRYTLKPRWGCSGRGRTAGGEGGATLAALQSACRRLAARGGAVLEPWLARTRDFSANLRLARDGSIETLDTLEQLVDRAGICRGHRGSLDARGAIRADSEHDEALSAAARALAAEAHALGYWGPAGLDAFAFTDGAARERLRPVVEWNARYTLGSVAIALVRRETPRLRAHFELHDERRCVFHFATSAPAAGWPHASDPRELLVVPLDPSDPQRGAGLLFARDRAALEGALARAPLENGAGPETGA